MTEVRILRINTDSSERKAMKLIDLDPTLLDEAKASRKLCTSNRSNDSLGASALSSCKSQGYRRREGDKSHKIGKNRKTVGGKKIKGKKYGGPLPDWS
jgi:hypothetical protein